MIRIRLGRLGYRMQGWGMHKENSWLFRYGERLQGWAVGYRPWLRNDDDRSDTA